MGELRRLPVRYHRDSAVEAAIAQQEARPLQSAMDRVIEGLADPRALADLIWMLHCAEHEYVPDVVMLEFLVKLAGPDYEVAS